MTDLTRGMVLTAGFTGWMYVVQSVESEYVVVSGRNGPMRVDRSELQSDIDAGNVGVRGQR